ncbi:hypothetical protein [Vibrio sp. D431a]|uniref:hypothetical protein n=1 Tax=Vibrio sp. D431a TaxID=2837388 RepID=UPI0025574AFA|nr:hypothetical protein [Vibrio sp. D431a]MDK9789852.1 hypothetical protein [Vibrio sp. D431a]
MIKSNKGFMLLEAILAMGIVSASVLLRAQYESSEMVKHDYNLLGRDLASLVSAVDKRVMLDGIESPVIWDSQWKTTQSTIDGLLKELVAADNPDCGVLGGWQPKLKENKDIRLIPCDLNKGLLKGFEAESERVGAGNLLQEWSVTIFSPEKRFNDLFPHFGRILESAQLNDVVRITGAHEYAYVDRSTNKPLTIGECFNLRSRCGIRATFRLNKLGIAEDYHLRVNGENSMRNSLTFSSAARPARCFRYEGSTKVDTTCGLEFDRSSDFLSLQGNEASLGSYNIVSDNLSMSPVFCTNIDSAGNQSKVLCGMTAVEQSGSVFAEAYITSVKVDGYIRMAKQGGRGIAFNVDSEGNVDASGDLSIQKDLKVSGSATVNDDLSVGADVRVKGGVEVSGNIKAKDIKASGQIESMFVKAQSTHTNDLYIRVSKVEGQKCTIGSIARSANGQLLSCVSGVYKAERGLISGMVFAFNGSCPKGTSKVAGMEGRTIVGSGRLNDGTLDYYYYMNRTGGKQRHKLSYSEMPKHQHVVPWGEAWVTKRWAPYGYRGGRGHTGSADSDGDNYRYLSSPEGGSKYHENRTPYRVFNYCKVD